MKATKALKRLIKIESLMSAVAERYSASAPHLRRVLEEAADAVVRAKQAVSLQASSGIKGATPKPHRAAKTPAPSQEKASVKNVAASGRKAKRAPIKKTTKKKTARKTAARPVAQAATEAVAQ
jgi:hypothetical protein